VREKDNFVTNNSEALYRQLGQLVADMPNLDAKGDYTPEMFKWLGMASVLTSRILNQADKAILASAINHLSGPLRSINAHQVTAIVYRALAMAEADAPAGLQGAFIPVGASFDVLQVISKVIGQAKSEVLIIDPYMDAKALTDFGVLAPVGVTLCLLSDSFSTKAEVVITAAERWIKQYGDSRPLFAHQTTPRALHDRLIIVDRSSVWSLTQSLKDFAGRSPASVVRIDGDVASMKLDAYRSIWEESKSLF